VPAGSAAQQAGNLARSAGEKMPRVNLVAAEITPRSGKERQAARALQALGFRVHAVGATISVDAPREHWRVTFAARFAPGPTPDAASDQQVTPVSFQLPAALEPFVESVIFVEPPELF
jgi:hypothetical protein